MLVGFFVAQTLLWVSLIFNISGKDRVSFAALGARGTPWIRQFVIPLLVVLAFQLVMIRTARWKRSVWHEPARTTRRWLIVFPTLMLLLAAGSRLVSAMPEVDGNYLVGMTATVALVGITEELTFRGILLVGGRRTFPHEWQVVVFTGALFGLFHLPNVMLGAAIGATLVQVVQTAVVGTAFYALRRVSGLLVPCMVLHAVYDWLVLIGKV